MGLGFAGLALSQTSVRRTRRSSTGRNGKGGGVGM